MWAKYWSGALANAACIAGGLFGLYLYQQYAIWGLGALFFLCSNRKSLTRSRVVATAVTATGMLLLYATIFNCNYLLAKFIVHRRHDAELAAIDCQLYSLIVGHTASYEGIFPLFRNHGVFSLFESGYIILFAEIMLTGLLIAVSNSRRDLFRFFAVLGAAYAIGLVTFAVFPAVGPPIAFPRSLASDFHNTVTYHIMSGEWAEFQALMQAKAINGLGYFVAVPSLHVLASVILQGFLRRSSVLFWAFMPINAVIVCSTVVLGQHYIVDLLAGLAVGAAMWPFTGVAPDVVQARHQNQARSTAVVLPS